MRPSHIEVSSPTATRAIQRTSGAGAHRVHEGSARWSPPPLDQHATERYLLQVTRTGKLILTK